MVSPQAQPIQWSKDKHKELESQLEEFWAQDEWDMSKCPLETTTSGKLMFNLESLTLKTEIKYACWRQFSTGRWSISAPMISGIRQILKWLSTIDG